MQVKQIAAACVIGFVGLRSWQSASAQQYAFADVMYPGANETMIEGINDAGVVVGTFGSSIDIRQAVNPNTFGFIRDGNTYQSLQAFGANATSATAVNNSGTVVGFYLTSANTYHAFVYNGASYADILPPTALEAVASDIDNSGVIIGTFSTSSGLSMPNPNLVDVHGFRAIPNGTGGYNYQTFDFSGAEGTYGNGRNNAGVEVGTAIKQEFLGTSSVGYVLPNRQYQYPSGNSLLTTTQFVSINDSGMVLGNATKYEFDAGSGEVRGYAQAFYVNTADLNMPSPSVYNIPLPGPTCGFAAGEACHKAVANDNELGQVVGFYDNNDGMLRGFIATPIELPFVGDYNQDGVVGAADYVVWRNTLDQTGSGLPADGDNSGSIDAGDYQIWRAHFGEASGGGVNANAAVPEPATLVLLILASTCLYIRRRGPT